MSDSPPLSFDDMRIDTLRHVAGLCAAAAMTAPKSGGQLFLKGAPTFIETIWVEDPGQRAGLAAWMRARGRERREAIWFRDAALCERVDGILLIGLRDWYPPVYDCGACGYATCAEYLDATTAQRKMAAQTFEFAGPSCNLRDVDLGIAVGSAAKTASLNKSTAAARRGSRSPLDTSASSLRTSPSPSRSASRTRRRASTGRCRTRLRRHDRWRAAPAWAGAPGRCHGRALGRTAPAASLHKGAAGNAGMSGKRQAGDTRPARDVTV